MIIATSTLQATSSVIDFTSYCQSWVSVNGSSTANITACYDPIDVQIFYMIDLIVFIFAIVIVYAGWKKYIHKEK